MLALYVTTQVSKVSEESLRGHAPGADQFTVLMFIDGMLHQVAMTSKYLCAMIALVEVCFL